MQDELTTSNHPIRNINGTGKANQGLPRAGFEPAAREIKDLPLVPIWCPREPIFDSDMVDNNLHTLSTPKQNGTIMFYFFF